MVPSHKILELQYPPLLAKHKPVLAFISRLIGYNELMYKVIVQKDHGYSTLRDLLHGLMEHWRHFRFLV